MILKKQITKIVMTAIVMSPFIGNGAIDQDLFRPMFNSNFQIMDKYVINQDFQAQNILKKEFLQNRDYIIIANPLERESLISYQQMLKIMPVGLYAGSTDANSEIRKIGDNAFTALIESKIAQTWSIVRAANLVDKNMNANLSINSDQSINADLNLSADDSKSETAVDHKLSVQLYALHNAVKVSYSGLLNASVMINEKTHETSIALSKELNTTASVSIQSVENSVESRQMVSLAMTF